MHNCCKSGVSLLTIGVFLGERRLGHRVLAVRRVDGPGAPGAPVPRACQPTHTLTSTLHSLVVASNHHPSYSDALSPSTPLRFTWQRNERLKTWEMSSYDSDMGSYLQLFSFVCMKIASKKVKSKGLASVPIRNTNPPVCLSVRSVFVT